MPKSWFSNDVETPGWEAFAEMPRDKTDANIKQAGMFPKPQDPRKTIVEATLRNILNGNAKEFIINPLIDESKEIKDSINGFYHRNQEKLINGAIENELRKLGK
jgi:hypothetical protein